MSHPDDSDQDPGWNSDDEMDYADQHAAPPSPMAHYPGLQDPLARFLSTVPDWSVLDKVALDNASSSRRTCSSGNIVARRNQGETA